MTARTDVHSPTSLITEDYEYLYADDNQRPGRLIGVDMDWWRSITNWTPELRERGTHQCHHCGARLRYFAILRHLPTGFSIVVGETCLDNRFSLATADFQRLRKQAELDRQAQRIKAEATEFVASLEGDVKVIMNRETVITEAFPFITEGSYAHNTISDIRRKVWNLYGNASERQIELVAKLIEEARVRAAQQAERDAEVKVAAPLGKVAFEGQVVSVKWQESMYGTTKKLIVKVHEADGVWLVYVSEPKAINADRGDWVRMTATLEPSDNNYFVFGKRPSKAEMIDAPEGLASALD